MIAPGVIVASDGWSPTEEISNPARGVPTRISVAASEGDSSEISVTNWAKDGPGSNRVSVGKGYVFVVGTWVSVTCGSVAISVAIAQAARIAIENIIYNKIQNPLRFTNPSLDFGIPKIIALNFY